MTDAQRPHPEHETETEVIPPVRSGDGIARTRELPVVEDAATVVTPPPAAPPPAQAPPAQPLPAQPPPAQPPPAQPPPAQPPPPVQPPPAQPPPASPQPASRPPTAVAPPTARRGVTRRPLVVAVVVVVAVLAVLAGIVALRGRGGAGSAGGSSQAAPVKLASTITSIDPSGGSGFRRDGAAWRTQTYARADFGGLKDGVGLLLDLGASAAVGKVTFDVVGAPIAVELRAGDSASGPTSGFQRVNADPSASGSTTLTVKGGGEHRYWLIWVTRLGAADGGYRAVIQAPTALGPRS